MAEAENYQHYQVLKREDGTLWELGRGAMGVTYKAFDTNLRCTVALKVINNAYLNNEIARQRFLREARAAAALKHQNVASVFHLGTDHDSYFYAMEFIDGETVDSYMAERGHLEPTEALNICLQVTRALSAAAKQQLVHRDLKPANLMLVDEEGEKIVKVIDFGLAKSAKQEGEDSGTLTIGGGFVGTPHFASPEQLEERDIDIRSDIYSLGATLYFMLTGRPTYSGSVAQIMSQHLYKPIPLEPLQGLPPGVISLIASMMEKDREKRPQTPVELRQRIQTCLEEINSTGAPTEVAATPVPGADEVETLDLTATEQELLQPRAVLAKRYQIVREMGDLPNGRRFLAYDLHEDQNILIFVLNENFLADRDRLTALEQAVTKLREAPHYNLRTIFSIESTEKYTFLTEEYVIGPLLVELLRSRGELTAQEAMRILELVAPAADHAQANQLQYVDLSLNGIQISYPGLIEAAVTPGLLHRSLAGWDGAFVKLIPLDFSIMQAAPAAADGWAGAATIVQGSGAQGSGPRSSYVRLVSLLLYELLGGPRNMVENSGRVSPLPALSEAGNSVLRRGIVDDFATANELWLEMRKVIGSKEPSYAPTYVPPGINPPSSSSSSSASRDGMGSRATNPGNPLPSQGQTYSYQGSSSGQHFVRPPGQVSTPGNSPGTGGQTTYTPPNLSPATRPPKKSGGLKIGLIIGLILFFLILFGVASYFVVQMIETVRNAGNRTISPTPAIVATPSSTPSASATPSAVVETSATPAPTVPATATPAPTVDLVEQQLQKANDSVRNGDWPSAMRTYTTVLQSNQDNEPARTRLENLLSEARSNRNKINETNFFSYKQDFESAANVGSVQAMLILGENSKKVDGEYALRWFEAAAERGSVDAKVYAGQLLSMHKNEEDDKKAFQYFISAADGGNADAKFYTGEDLYFGKGTTKDVAKAMTYLQEAAALRQPFAVDLLGIYFRQRKDFARARQYFEEGVALDYAHSYVNLGVMHMNGEGVPQNKQKAAQLWKQAAQKGDTRGMFFYATCLYDGNGVARDPQEATDWAKKAAKAGESGAIKWCQDKKVEL